MRQIVLALVAVVLVLTAGGQLCPASDAVPPRSCGTALLVIDVQNICAALSTPSEWTTIDGVQLTEKLVNVLAAARVAGIPIVYIQYVAPGYAIGDPQLNTVSAIAPLPGDPIVWKTRADSFQNTPLASLLNGIGAHRLLLTGQSTDVCVYATALGAVRNGYETWVIADAHAGLRSRTDLAHYNSMWPSLGVSAIESDKIDFAAYGCVTLPSP
ncbi:MAG: isochorismatase family cysteine hydrolase [Thermotogota bacterium]